MRSGRAGRTVVSLEIAADAQPADPVLGSSSGHTDLDEAALLHVHGCVAAYRRLAPPPKPLLPGKFGVPCVWKLP
jgi:hypothetical protein